MSLMVILSHADPDIIGVGGTSKPKVEWVEADYWVNREGALECYKTSNGQSDDLKVAEFSYGKWIGVKLYAREEKLADDISSDPRVQNIMVEHLIDKLK